MQINKASYAWPPACLSPNSRSHWALKSKHAKQVKNDAWAQTKLSGIVVDKTKRVKLDITFRTPTKARHDLDNSLSRCKSLLDGVALALGVDDSKFEITIKFGKNIKGGAVEIEFF